MPEDPKAVIDPNSGFVKKTVGTTVPVTQASVADSIKPPVTPAPVGGGFKDFYRANKIYFFAFIFGLLIISFLSYFAFRKQSIPTLKDANVAVNIETADSAPSGGDAVYRIMVQNNDSNKLVGLQLELIYPEGTSYVSSSPKPINLSGSLFAVPDLINGQNAVLIVQTKLVGNINDVKTLTAKLHYKYSNFNSEFIKQQQKQVRLVASDLTLELTGPITANNGQPVTYNVSYKNNSDKQLQNSRIQVDYPDGFIFDSASTPPDLNNNNWNVSSLAPGADGDIQIQGSYKSVSPGESRTVTAEFLSIGGDGKYYTQSQATFISAIASTPLVVSQEVQTQSGDNVVRPGEGLNFTVNYQNNGNTAASGVNIVLSLNSKVLDLSTLRAEGGQLTGSSILWNAASNPGLESLSPNQQGQLTFSVQIKNPATKDSSKNLSVDSSVKIKSNEFDSFFNGNDLSLKVSSPSGIGTYLSYVSGPLPPRVGQTTTYKLTINLSNSTNDFSDGALTAFVPLNSGGFDGTTINSSEAGKVDFDSTTGKLNWRFASLPAHTGQFSQSRSLSFNVKLNPVLSQVNTSPVLIKGISLSAKDTFTGIGVNQIANDVTSAEARGGDNSYGNGLVQP